MKVRQIKINQITIPETRVTAVYDEETATLLRETVKKLGVIQPLVVVETKDGYRLVDGFHRLEEERRLGHDKVDAVVYEGEEKDALLFNLFLNKVHGKAKASEMVKVIGVLYTEYGLDPDGIKDATGVSRDLVEKLIRISEAAPSVQEALDEEVIGIGKAFEISRLPHLIQQDECVAKCRLYPYTVKDLRNYVNQALEFMKEPVPAPATAQTRVSKVYLCEGCKNEVAPRYLRPVMLCPDCFGNVWRLAKQAEVRMKEEAGPEQEEAEVS